VISLKPGTVNLRNLQRPWTPHCHWPGTLDGRCHQLQPVGLRHFSPSASLSIFHILYIIIFIYQIIFIIIDMFFILLIYCFSNFCSCPHVDSGMPCISYPCGAQKSASHKLTPNPSRPRENPSECAAPSTPCDSQVRMDVVVTKVAIYKEIVQQIPVLPHKAVAEVSKIGNL